MGQSIVASSDYSGGVETKIGPAARIGQGKSQKEWEGGAATQFMKS